MMGDYCHLCGKDCHPYICIEGCVCKDCYTNSQKCNWISIKERLPTEDQYVLIYNNRQPPFCIGYYSSSNKCWYFKGEGNPIFWMAIPEIPTKEEVN